MISSPRLNVRPSVIYTSKANPCLVFHDIKRTLYLIVLPVSLHLGYSVSCSIFVAQCVCFYDLLDPHHIPASLDGWPRYDGLS